MQAKKKKTKKKECKTILCLVSFFFSELYLNHNRKSSPMAQPATEARGHTRPENLGMTDRIMFGSNIWVRGGKFFFASSPVTATASSSFVDWNCSSKWRGATYLKETRKDSRKDLLCWLNKLGTFAFSLFAFLGTKNVTFSLKNVLLWYLLSVWYVSPNGYFA